MVNYAFIMHKIINFIALIYFNHIHNQVYCLPILRLIKHECNEKNEVGVLPLAFTLFFV